MHLLSESGRLPAQQNDADARCVCGRNLQSDWSKSMLASMQQRKSASVAKGNEAAVPEVPPALPDSRAGFWLDAHYDPVANLKAFSTCLHTCDLYGDGDWRLAVAGLDKKLKASIYARLASA